MHFNTRLRVLSLGVIVFAIILIAKLYFVQIVDGEEYRDKAEHQYVAGANYFDRGNIYFSTKDDTDIPAAAVESGFVIFLNPKLLVNENLDDIYKKVSAVLPISYNEFIAKAGKSKDTYEEIAKRQPQEVAEKINLLKIAGLSTARERWRVYPGKNLAAQTVGIVGYQGTELAGRYGLERQYEKTLERTPDNTFVNFFAEIFSNIEKAVKPNENLEGDVVTTIEPSAQAFLEEELQKVETNYSSDFSGGIVMDPNTGEIIAMAQNPSFDPNNLSGIDIGVLRNKFVEDRYEMGSIIKPITMAAGLDAGVVTAHTTYNDPGCMTLNTKTFCNYDLKSHGTKVEMQQVLNQSLNTGAAFVAGKLGNKNFSDYLKKFGLNEITHIDLPNEGKSLVANIDSGRDLEMAQASFGQGIALTPVTTVRALAALGNGGTLVTPHLVKEIKYKVGGSKVLEYPGKDTQPRVISATTSEEISRMLTTVVDTALRDGHVRFDNYSVAAKTGTAQIANPNGGGYYSDRYLHSFFGYFPSYDPKFIIFLYTYYPKGVQYASETLTDTFINTVKFLINYYNIAPDRTAPPNA